MERISFVVLCYFLATWLIFYERIFGHSIRGNEQFLVILIYLVPIIAVWYVSSKGSYSFFQGIARSVQEKNMKSFLNIVKGMDGHEVAFVTLFANNLRIKFLKEKGVDLHDPMMAFYNDPEILSELSLMAREYQSCGQDSVAAGTMVWVNTLRGAADPHLRGYSREIWGELERGFEHVLDASLELFHEKGMLFSIEGATNFPIGFTPKPI